MSRHSVALNLTLIIVLNLVLCAPRSVAATPANNLQRIFAVQQTVAFDRSIPSPRNVLGFMPGDARTIADWRQITDYFARLAKASDRVRVRTLGETTLHRPLIAAFISAPENIRDLTKYQNIQRELADPRLVKSEAMRDQLLREGKTVVAISCSIHSTEIVASQMSMQLAYELASAEDEATREILANAILILIPSANPDGIDIVADWYRKTLNTKYEGTEPPELYHYYAGHDDNRDWFMLDLRETQILTRLFWKEWFPQIVYDVHQQGQTGSRFFIPPFYDPLNPRIDPLLLRKVGLIGHKIAADLESAGEEGVITNAMYDTWWHGGFRTAPYYHNSIGILSEAASARLMTPVEVTREQLAKARTRGMASALQATTNFPDPWPGGTWTPRDIMRMELIAARSVLSLAAKYRAGYLKDFYELGRRAVAEKTKANEALAYLIPAGQGRDEAVAKLIGLLVEQGVEVYRLDRELHLTTVSLSDQQIAFAGGTGPDGQPIGIGGSFSTQQTGEQPAGSYIVFLAQPYRANVQSLFERQVYPDRRTAGGEAERPYDVAGWTLPFQMGVEAKAVLQIQEPVEARRLTLVQNTEQVRRDLALPLQAKTNDAAPVQSPISNPIKRRVRLALYKSWTASMDEGWTRWLFDTFNVPFTSLRDEEIRRGDLRTKYDVIILPSQRAKEIIEGNPIGSYPSDFTGGITEAGVENLRRFTEAGGTLICFDAASELAIKRFNLPLRNVLADLKSSQFYCPGSILRLTVNTNHPLAQNLAADVDAYFINSSAFEVMDQTSAPSARVQIVARYAEKDVLRSGWLLGENYLAGKAALVEVALGRGRIILFAFRPQHRGQSWGTFPFIFNAIMQGAGQSGI
jgi:hypothetical protein